MGAGRKSSLEMHRRLKRALGFCGLLGVVIAVSGRASAAYEQPDVFDCSPAWIAAHVDDPFPDELFEGLTPHSQLPSWITEEFFVLGDIQTVYGKPEEKLAGIVVKNDVNHVTASIADQMAHKGWIDLPTGIPGITNYSREKGDCRWAIISVLEVADGVSVVIQAQ